MTRGSLTGNLNDTTIMCPPPAGSGSNHSMERSVRTSTASASRLPDIQRACGPARAAAVLSLLCCQCFTARASALSQCESACLLYFGRPRPPPLLAFPHRSFHTLICCWQVCAPSCNARYCITTCGADDDNAFHHRYDLQCVEGGGAVCYCIQWDDDNV